MKKNNPMYKQFLDQYEHQWFECLTVFASSIDSLKDKKEDERMERVKENSNLQEIVVYTKFSCPYCKQII